MSKRKGLLLYILFGVFWVFATDFIIDKYIADKDVFMMIQKAKGLFFILLTGFLLYFFLSKNEKYIELKEEERRLHTLINSMVDFVNFKDGEGKWIEANDFGLNLFELKGVDYKGKKDSDLAEYSSFYKDVLKYCEISDEEAWKAKVVTRCEEMIPLPSGDFKTFDTIKVPLFHQDGSRKSLVVMGRDITERINAEKKLSKNRQQYKSLFDYNPDPVYMMDLNGILTDVNPQFESIVGLSHNKVIGASINDFIFPFEEEKNKLMQAFAYVKKHKTGMNTGDIRFCIMDRIAIFSCTFVPILIDDRLTGIISYAKDVTHIRETEERLRKTEKLSVVGELAASVAHEVRNPLTSLKGFVQLLKDGESQYQHYYSIMLNELDRINQIVSELLVLAKPQQMKFEEYNLVHLMTDVKSLLEPQANLYGTHMIFDVKHKLPSISCEANQLKQVFINIIKNSIEASSKKIHIDLQAEKDWMTITVKDDGCGIEKNRIKHLGEPFYSSKEKGTGLGLTVSYRIIEAHRGKISIKSEVDNGTEIKIALPVS
ncbi:PAS domain S-box protein [Peribacillus glennii]|uniref:histidine kinase n=2 Tax=Peribacillus glennii TaxID=2303991 RepID=A0A372L647_9BACI|nr:PAS domain S-box protein [Peribacillus glennii]